MIFNGTTASVVGTAVPSSQLVGVSATVSCAEVDVGGAGDTTQNIEGGVPVTETTVEVKGTLGIAKGETGAVTIGWGPGGAASSFGSITAAICTKVGRGGSKDGATTATYTFKPNDVSTGH
jgi:hypothetical protein